MSNRHPNTHKDWTVIVTDHAEKRFKERSSMIDSHYSATVAFQHGKPPRSSFDPSKTAKPKGFDSFLYREMLDYIYVYGLYKHEKTAYLITVYEPLAQHFRTSKLQSTGS